MEYRVLTLWQPWATLLVHRIKKIETRPAPTSWTEEKGTYLIHAAKKWNNELKQLCTTEPFYSALTDLGYFERGTFYSDKYLPTGCIIGSIEIIECVKIPIDYRTNKMLGFICANVGLSITEQEIKFGDYTPGRYMWLSQNPRVLKEPILYMGGQGYYQNFHGDESKLIFN
jgi:hypothetical protein